MSLHQRGAPSAGYVDGFFGIAVGLGLDVKERMADAFRDGGDVLEARVD